jgi:hypothetical protein
MTIAAAVAAEVDGVVAVQKKKAENKLLKKVLNLLSLMKNHQPRLDLRNAVAVADQARMESHLVK